MDAALLTTRFCSIIATLRHAIAARGAEQKTTQETRGLFLLLWSRLNRAAARFCALAAGAPAPKPRPHRTRTTEQKTRPHAPDLPRRRAWILAPVPEASCSAGQLRAFLAEPEVQTLITADPRFGRILRPLCRTLGLKLPDFLRLPKPPGSKKRRKRKRGAKKPKFLSGMIMSAPLALQGPPRGYIPRRRTRAPPRPA